MARGRGCGDAGESFGLHERVIFVRARGGRELGGPGSCVSGQSHCPRASVKSYVPFFVTIGTQAPPLT
jgi:hypothetical protein